MSNDIVSENDIPSLPDSERVGLTDKQARFAAAVAEGAPGDKAVIIAGYSPAASRLVSKQLLSDPKIQRAIDRAIQRKLRYEAAPNAIKYLIDLLKDEKASHRERRGAANDLLGLAGYTPPAAGEKGGAAKSPSEMSQDELRAFLGDLESELAKRATPIEGAKATDSAAPAAQAIDFIE